MPGSFGPGNNSHGDDVIAKTYQPVGDAGPEHADGTRKVLSGFDPDKKYQYLLVWITQLPRSDDGRYRITVDEVEVYGN